MNDDLPKVIPNTCADVKLLRVSRYAGDNDVRIEELPIVAWTYERSELPNSDGQMYMIPQTIKPMNTTFSKDYIVYGGHYQGEGGFHGQSREETVEHALFELRQEEKWRDELEADKRRLSEAS
jgi:hypothetical protein